MLYVRFVFITKDFIFIGIMYIIRSFVFSILLRDIQINNIRRRCPRKVFKTAFNYNNI